MKSTFQYPKLAKEARLGEIGVERVCRIFNENFCWLFRRTHQEHDFGVDGYVDIVLDDGSVTGQILAVQIKHGVSFFGSKTANGYTYRGEIKHFNYLSNSQVPTLIVLSHPKDGTCYWQVFDPSKCSHNEKSWSIEIPFNNRLADSKDQIRLLCPPLLDHLQEHQHAAITADFIREAGYIAVHVPKEDVKAMKVDVVRDLFDSLKRTKQLALAAQGKVAIYFSGYDADPRELFEISEVRMYMPLLDYALPELFFFARTENPGHTLPTFALCQVPIAEKTLQDGLLKLATVGEYLAAFLTRHWPGLNQMTEWLELPEEENERIGKAAAKCITEFNPEA